MRRSAQARAYDRLQREAYDDECAEIRARGDIPPHRDGSPSTVAENCHAGMPDFATHFGSTRIHCSCGYVGEWRSGDDKRALLTADVEHHKEICR